MKRAELMNYSHLENAPKLSQCTQRNVIKFESFEKGAKLKERARIEKNRLMKNFTASKFCKSKIVFKYIRRRWYYAIEVEKNCIIGGKVCKME